ncbi:hypothetical protein IR083_07815 [Dysgonomonas sp. GY75]|uniref:hypothetical protein n=1 Tax=Dysgonomonas sp. GY75 TaxID=2780419 RepID=UPI001883EF05|nr:hypothetical protein [Dysgonomonas sp. GY75]MBF0648723.1 hypothetical protein [Dysgonomonas sp. GY75]
MPETTIIPQLSPGEEYLRNPDTPNTLYIRYLGKKRRLFINDRNGSVYMFMKGSRKRGYPFTDFSGISRIYYPQDAKVDTPGETERRHVLKCKREAAKASFTNPFIRKCLVADENKTACENGISGGSINSGKIISLTSIAKKHPWEVKLFRQALANKSPYTSFRIPFRGYEMTISIEPCKEGDNYNSPGDIRGYLNLEYKDCLNGYYYLLINDENFIGYEKD